jgi:hypothetical protein
MEMATGEVVMEACHCDLLELGLQVFDQALEECLKSVRFSEVEPGCVRGAHLNGFQGCGLLLEFVRGKSEAEGIRNGHQVLIAGRMVGRRPLAFIVGLASPFLISSHLQL